MKQQPNPNQDPKRTGGIQTVDGDAQQKEERREAIRTEKDTARIRTEEESVQQGNTKNQEESVTGDV